MLLVHVLLSLVGIVTGLVVARGMLRSDRMPRWTDAFLATTVLTSVTGFFLPATKFLPSHATGILSLLILAVTLYAWYGKKLAGSWRWIYVATAIAALYLNVFVGVVQAFLKIDPLKALAPQQNEPPFIAAQAVVLIAFVVLGVVAAKRFRPTVPG
jgi:hypothetical protein